MRTCPVIPLNPFKAITLVGLTAVLLLLSGCETAQPGRSGAVFSTTLQGGDVEGEPVEPDGQTLGAKIKAALQLQASEQEPAGGGMEERLARLRLTHSSTFGFMVDQQYLQTNLAYGVNLKDSGWMVWEDPFASFPTADFALITEGGRYFALISAFYLGTQPVDPNLLLEALQSLELGPRHGGNRRMLERTREGDQWEAVYEKQWAHQSKSVRARFRALYRRPFVYHVQVLDETGQDDSGLLESVDRLFPLAEVPADFALAETLTNRQREAHVIFDHRLSTAFQSRGRVGEAIRYAERAYRAFENNPVLLANVADLAFAAGRTQYALDTLESEQERFPGERTIQARIAFLRAEQGRVSEAADLYGEVFDGSFHEEQFFQHYLALLNRIGRTSEAIEVASAALEAAPSKVTRIALVDLLGQADRQAEALELIESDPEALAFDRDLQYAHARIFLVSEEYDRLLEVLSEYQDSEYPDAQFLVYEAFARMGQQQLADARDTLERALEVNPDHAEARTMLDTVTLQLGQGDTRMVRRELQAVPLPESVQKALDESVPPPAYSAQYGAWHPLIAYAYEFRPGERLAHTRYEETTIREASSLSDFKELQIEFDPSRERVFVNELRVYNVDGKLVGEGSLDRSYVTDHPGAIIKSQRKILHVPVAGLQAGGRYSTAITFESLGPADGFQFAPHLFASDLPVGLRAVSYRGPEEALHWQKRGDIDHYTDPGGDFVWLRTENPVIREEPYLPPQASYQPVLWLGPTGKRWEDLAREYAGTLAPFLEVDSFSRDQAIGIAGEVSGVEKRTGAVLRYLQDNYTYQALLFGVRAMIPNTPAVIRENRFGDCKDHAVLMVQLLRSLGIEAYPALVDTTRWFNPAIPSMEQFDHMIVYIPALARCPFVDPTDKQHVAGQVPRNLGGIEALIVDPENPRLEMIPPYEEDHGRLDVARRIEVHHDGAMQVHETVRFHGALSSRWRDFLDQFDEASEADRVRSFLYSFREGFSINALEISVPPERGEPVELTIDYRYRDRFHSDDGRLTGRLPSLIEKYYLLPEPLEERIAPIHFTPLRMQADIDVTWPEEFQLAAGAGSDPESDGDSPFNRYSFTTGRGLNQLRINLEMDCLPGMYQATDYGRFQQAYAQPLGKLESRLVLQRRNP